ncbi:hypothetical protein IMY05_C2125000200 [Salix suchowensis]|nr:hypothetical protein IMY05_C2125000200 [Salix suchowensis]
MDLDEVHAQSLRQPRLLHDGNIFLALYPKDTMDMGALFKPVDISGDQLASLIKKNPSGLWSLDYVTQVQWERLESMLKDVADVLLRSYRATEQFDMPVLVAVKFPHTNAIHGFKILSAYVSFAFAIWLKSSPEDALGDAAHQLQRAGLPLSAVTMNRSCQCTHLATLGKRRGSDVRRPIMCFVYYPPAYALDIAKSRYIVDASKSALDALAFDCASEHATKSTKSRSPLTIPSASIESYRETGWDITSSEAEPGYISDEYSPEDSTQDIDDTEEYSEIHSPSSSQLPPPIISSARVFAQMTVPSIEAYLRIRHGYSINCIATSPSHVDLYDDLVPVYHVRCDQLVECHGEHPKQWNESSVRMGYARRQRHPIAPTVILPHRRRHSVGKRCYILSSPKGSLSDWAIAMTSPSALLSIYRQSDITTIQAAAKSLLEFGVPFRTVISRPLRTRPSSQAHLVANPLLEAMTAIQCAPHDFYPSYEG